jgi:hypothetical protein
MEPEVGFEPTTFRLPVETHPSNRYQPDRSWLLTSAGSSSQYVPDLPCYGRGRVTAGGMTKGMTGLTHGRPAGHGDFRSGSEVAAPTGKPGRRRRLLKVRHLPTAKWMACLWRRDRRDHQREALTVSFAASHDRERGPSEAVRASLDRRCGLLVLAPPAWALRTGGVALARAIPTHTLWSILGGCPGRRALALVGEAGSDLTQEDEGHGAEDGGRLEAASENDGKDEGDPDDRPGQDAAQRPSDAALDRGERQQVEGDPATEDPAGCGGERRLVGLEDGVFEADPDGGQPQGDGPVPVGVDVVQEGWCGARRAGPGCRWWPLRSGRSRSTTGLPRPQRPGRRR